MRHRSPLCACCLGVEWPPASQGRGQELRDEYHQAPRDTVSQEVYDGWKQYNLNCARCHGEDVQGTTIAPHLITVAQARGSDQHQGALHPDRLRRPARQGDALLVRAGHGAGDHQEDLRIREGSERRQAGTGAAGA